MTTIKRYTNMRKAASSGGSSPKGSKDNPYTEEEYNNIPEENWKGGYVEGIGYVGPGVVVTPSSEDPSDPFSDLFSHLFSDGSSDCSSSFSGGGGGGGGFVGGDGGNDSGDGGNGGHQTGGGGNHGDDSSEETPSSETLSAHSLEVLSKASTFSQKVAATLAILRVQGIIVENPAVNLAQWNATAHRLEMGPNANFTNILHELVHFYQPEEINPSHAVREYQAYFVGEIIRCMYESMPSDETAKFGLTSNLLFELNMNCGGDRDGRPTISQSVVDYINDANPSHYVQSFMNYWRDIDLGNNSTEHASYYDRFDPDYNWNWGGIFNEMGINIGVPVSKIPQ